MIVRERLAQGGRILAASLSPQQSALEAEMLLASALGRERAWLYAHPELGVSEQADGVYAHWLRRRALGEPLEYLTGSAEFYGLKLSVTPDVLVPRPETEVLVALALDELTHRSAPLVADVGTGSGAIALAVAANHAGARILATDASHAALRLARGNAAALGLAERIWPVCCDLLSCAGTRFQAIVANLPYVATADLEGVSAPVARYEPWLALDGGKGGLTVVERLLNDARRCLAPGGTILAEIGEGQGERALALARASFSDARVEVLRDLAGHERVLRVRSE